MQQLLSDWDELAPTVKSMIEEGLVPPGPIISDTVVHELDIRGMAGLPYDLSSPGFAYVFRRQLDGLAGRIKEANLSGLVIKTETLKRKVGTGQPDSTRQASTYDLSRALTGRRSRRQVATFDWTGNYAPYQEVLTPRYPGAFCRPEEDLIEG